MTTPDQQVLAREFPADMIAGDDGHTVDVRIVPYGKPTQVSDGGPIYREEWVEGAFDDQLVAGHRLKVLLNFEHEHGVSGQIGKGIALRSQPDGLHGSFVIRDNDAGKWAFELVRDGILNGVSLEAQPKKTETINGIVRRVRAHLRNVALCRHAAYPDAVVTAYRGAPVFDEELLPTDLDPETVERCRRLGLKLPQRYEAHPENGHPGETGTPEDGTRQTVATATSEEPDGKHAE